MSGSLRLLRGLILGLAMVLLTSAAHASAHGQLPDAGGLALLIPVSVGLSTIAMERKRGVLWFVLYALGIQALLHVLLVTVSAHSSPHSSLLPDQTMLLAHGITAGLLALLLAHGDALLLRWVAYMSTVLYRALIPLRLIAAMGIDNFAPVAALSQARAIEFSIPRRGPPASCQ